MGLSRAERKIRNANIVKLAAAGVTAQVIAEQYSLATATVRSIIHKNRDQLEATLARDSAIIEARERELVDQAALHLMKHAKAAAKVVVEVMHEAPDDKTRLSAAFGLLDRVGLSPKKEEHGQDGGKDMVSTELAERMLAALESASTRPTVDMSGSQFLINGQPTNLEPGESFEDVIDSIPFEGSEPPPESEPKSLPSSTKTVVVRNSE